MPVVNIYLYPFRGIPGIPVDELWLGECGVRHDRIFLIADAKTLFPLSTENCPLLTSLKQEFVDCIGEEGKLICITSTNPERLQKVNLQKSLLIELDEVPKNEFIKCKNGYNGYKLNEDANLWLSCALGREVIAIRSTDERLTAINPARLIYSKPDDRKKTFTTDAALHMINLASVREL